MTDCYVIDNGFDKNNGFINRIINMEYLITTTNAARLVRTIFESVTNGVDPQGNNIETWAVRHNGHNEKRLVHTTNQWEDEGNIEIVSKRESSNHIVIAKFHYWHDFPTDQRTGDEKYYYYGRFTELLLVHFKECYSDITIHVI